MFCQLKKYTSLIISQIDLGVFSTTNPKSRATTKNLESHSIDFTLHEDEFGFNVIELNCGDVWYSWISGEMCLRDCDYNLHGGYCQEFGETFLQMSYKKKGKLFCFFDYIL